MLPNTTALDFLDLEVLVLRLGHFHHEHRKSFTKHKSLVTTWSFAGQKAKKRVTVLAGTDSHEKAGLPPHGVKREEHV